VTAPWLKIKAGKRIDDVPFHSAVSSTDEIDKLQLAS
jgi:hypothetical protein